MRATSASVPAHGDSVPLPHAGRSPRLRAIAAPLIALVLLLAVPAAASAASLLDTTVSATGTVERACFTRDLSSAAGVDAHTVRAPGVSVVRRASTVTPATTGTWRSSTRRAARWSRHRPTAARANSPRASRSERSASWCRPAGAPATETRGSRWTPSRSTRARTSSRPS